MEERPYSKKWDQLNTPEAQANLKRSGQQIADSIRKAQEDFAAGRYTSYRSVAELLADIEREI